MYLTELSKMQRKKAVEQLTKSGGVRWSKTKLNSNNFNFPTLSILQRTTAQRGPINDIYPG